MTALVKRAESSIGIWSREQIDLIKSTVCPGDLTDNEFGLFLHIAGRSGLDPLLKQVHCTKRGGRMVVVAGIDGLAARADSFPDFRGIAHGVVCAKDDFIFDAANGVVLKHTYNPFGERGATVGAWAIVTREGRSPYAAMVKFSEYANGSSNPLWKSIPTAMIDKVARSTAYRMAYPTPFGGIYEPAELDQSEKDVGPTVSIQSASIAASSPTSSLKAVLLEKSKPKPPIVVDVQSGETEQQAEQRQAEEPAVKYWDAVMELQKTSGMDNPQYGEFLRGLGYKTKAVTKTDVERIKAALAQREEEAF